MKREVLLLIASCLVAVAGLELAARAILIPSEGSAGILMGRRLPPFRIIPRPREQSQAGGPESPQVKLLVDGKRITVSDLEGYHRPDNLLGYTYLENAVSVNGWWQSNNIGAQSRTDTKPEIPIGKKRVLVFGESFAAGSRLRQEEAWPSILNSLDSRQEVVNLAVGGFSMGQAYARYLSFKAVLEHNLTLMMFAPTSDLWRDVNTIRDLYAPWDLPVVLPRFVIEHDSLKLVPSPYSNRSELNADNYDGLSLRLRDHLRRYDRFYFRSLYEDPPIIGNLIIYKLVALAVGQHSKEAIKRGLMVPGSEAMEVSHAIFLAMQADEKKVGAEFALLILPTEDEINNFPDFSKTWQDMVNFTCKGVRHCIDLAPVLLEIPQQNRDRGYDGGHYGPVVNRRIGEAVHTELVHQGLLPQLARQADERR
jgi:hypothetical protein